MAKKEEGPASGPLAASAMCIAALDLHTSQTYSSPLLYTADLQSAMHSLPGAASSLHSRQHASQTLYMAMSIQANQVPVIFDICASFSSWLTLAGFVVLPATFTSPRSQRISVALLAAGSSKTPCATSNCCL